jgi:hypothetical protein
MVLDGCIRLTAFHATPQAGLAAFTSTCHAYHVVDLIEFSSSQQDLPRDFRFNSTPRDISTQQHPSLLAHIRPRLSS